MIVVKWSRVHNHRHTTQQAALPLFALDRTTVTTGIHSLDLVGTIFKL